MKRVTTPVRLSAKDWKLIYDALTFEHGCRCSGCMIADRANRHVLRKIGANGMAARDRGVAKVKR